MTTIQQKIMLLEIGKLAIEWAIEEKQLSTVHELHKNRSYDLRNPVLYESEMRKALAAKKVLEETCQAYIDEHEAPHDK